MDKRFFIIGIIVFMSWWIISWGLIFYSYTELGLVVFFNDKNDFDLPFLLISMFGGVGWFGFFWYICSETKIIEGETRKIRKMKRRIKKLENKEKEKEIQKKYREKEIDLKQKLRELKTGEKVNYCSYCGKEVST